MAGGQWWVVWSMASQQADQISAKVVQSASQPNANGKTVWQVWGPYATKADATAAENNRDPGSGQLTPGAASQAGAPPGLDDLSGVTDFLGRLKQGATWERAAEILIGGVLLAIGINALFKGRPLQVVTGAAGAVGKAVA